MRGFDRGAPPSLSPPKGQPFGNHQKIPAAFSGAYFYDRDIWTHTKRHFQLRKTESKTFWHQRQSATERITSQEGTLLRINLPFRWKARLRDQRELCVSSLISGSAAINRLLGNISQAETSGPRMGTDNAANFANDTVRGIDSRRNILYEIIHKIRSI